MYQLAEYIKKETGVRQLGAIQAKDFYWCANILRAAQETWKRDMPFIQWFLIWKKAADEMELLDN